MPTMKILKLPAPDPRYAFYTLPDGSRIYPSNVAFADEERRQCRWFVWRCTGSHECEEWDVKGNRRSISLVKDGDVWMDKKGLRYFDTPQEALAALAEVMR